MNLLEALGQAIRIPELRRKLLFTLGLLGAFRILAAIAIPGTNPVALNELFSGNTLLGLLNLFSGGGLQRFTLVALGLNPYINATIIMQLMTVVSVRLKELSKEGEIGRKKITRYTRWLTVPLAMLQAFGYLALFTNPQAPAARSSPTRRAATEISIILTLTAGTIIAMWLGELITEYGVGNGVSLIIFVGIIGRLPAAIVGYGGTGGTAHIIQIVVMAIIAVAVTAGVIEVQQAQRKDPGAIGATRPQRAHRSGIAGTAQLPTASSQRRGRHPDHLRDLDHDLPDHLRQPLPEQRRMDAERCGVDHHQLAGDRRQHLPERRLQRHLLPARDGVHVLLHGDRVRPRGRRRQPQETVDVHPRHHAPAGAPPSTSARSWAGSRSPARSSWR